MALAAIRNDDTFADFQGQLTQRMRDSIVGFSFSKAIEAIARDPLAPEIRGFELEMLQEWGGPDFDLRSWRIPWNVLALRDLNVADGGVGGYLAGTDALPVRDILRPFSVTARLGVEFVENVRGAQTLPATNGKATITWLDSETDAATPGTPTMMQSSGEAKIAIGLVQFSRRLRTQADPEQFVRRELLRTAGGAIDVAAIAGTGLGGQPLGIVNVPGIGTEAGAALAHADVLSMKRKCADADADDETISFLGTPAVRELLEQREVITDSGQFIWQNDRVADRAAYVSTDCPDATLIAGSWPTALLLLWGNGVQLDFSRFDPVLFRQGIVVARVLVSVDVLFPTPAAFTAAAGVS
jgi:HK97 family phage major capsid protein